MQIHAWQETDPDRLEPLYRREQDYWLDVFSWDTSTHWPEIERARLTWGLPGLVATDGDGVCRGWCFYVADQDVAHVGGLVASSEDTTAALIDHVLAANPGVHCFMPDRAPGVFAALTSRGFSVEPHLYLERRLSSGHPVARTFMVREASRKGSPHVKSLSALESTDIVSLARLLQAAYPTDAARHFAPNGAPAEWDTYVRGLVEQTGCGVFQRELTRVARAGDGLAGAIVMTSIGLRTAHVAQLAVHPAHRGQGLAAELLAGALERSAHAGMDRVTLLVAESNAAARALYESRGFVARGTFIAARRN